jgi:hypothetical protein
MPDVVSPLQVESLAQAAQHECGHAAISIALGYPVERITLIGQQGPTTYPVEGVLKLFGQLVLIQVSGFVADYQRRGLRMRGSQVAKLLIGGDGDRFEVDNAFGQVAVRPSRAFSVAPGADLHEWAALVAREHHPPALIVSMWRECEAYTAACRPAIDALAAQLLGGSDIDGADASRIAAAAMAGKPVQEAPDWARR